MVLRNPYPTLYLSTPSPENSPPSSTVFSDCDADDEDTMSAEEHIPSRPLSLALSGLHPVGPYCPRVPTLQEILANQAPPPWTLSAFTAHLSQKQCLENLEFLKDADQYRIKYDALSSHLNGAPMLPDYEESKQLRRSWQKIVNAYIVPDSLREVNLPGDVRDALLSLPNSKVPPSPRYLDAAVKIIYELMDESILMTFISELSPPPRPSASIHGEWEEPDERLHMRNSADGIRHRSRSRRKTSPALDAASNQHGSSARHSQIFSPKHRFGTHTSISSTGSGDIMSGEDSVSLPSPTDSPMTPPTTPPSSDLSSTSPRPRQDPWKKMKNMLGQKKKSASKMDRTMDE